MELGNDFFLFKCEDKETFERAFTEDFWVIIGNYVDVHKWKLSWCA